MTTPNPKSHSVENDLKAYLDGQLRPLARWRVFWHIARHPECREEMEAMRRISDEIKTSDGGADAGVLKPDLRARILAAVPPGKPEGASEAGGDAASRTKGGRRPVRPPLLVWGAVATAAVGWFAFVPLRSHFQQLDAKVGANVVASMPEASMTKSLGSVKSNSQEIGTATQMYQQDYEEKYAKSEAPQVAAGALPASPMSQVAKPVSRQAQRTYSRATPGFISNGSGRPTMQWQKDKSGYGASAGMQADTAGEARQVHKDADITLETAQVEQASEAAENLARTSGGYVASNQLSTGDVGTDNEGLKTATLVLKIPVKRFDAILQQASKLGELKGKNVSGEDLTEQISDETQAEKTLQNEITTTREKLAERRERHEQAENRGILRELKIRAAQAQARLDNLHKLGALSTLTVNIVEKPKAKPTPAPTGGFLSDLNDTMHDAGHSLVQAAKLPLVTIVWLLAYAPLWIVLLAGYRYAVRR